MRTAACSCDASSLISGPIRGPSFTSCAEQRVRRRAESAARPGRTGAGSMHVYACRHRLQAKTSGTDARALAGPTEIIRALQRAQQLAARRHGGRLQVGVSGTTRPSPDCRSRVRMHEQAIDGGANTVCAFSPLRKTITRRVRGASFLVRTGARKSSPSPLHPLPRPREAAAVLSARSGATAPTYLSTKNTLGYAS